MSLYKILLVDDEEEVRTGIIKKIPWEELGYEVVGDAENGEDALEKVRILEPDLVLTDIKMPYMDGLTLAERIRQERSSTEIVIFSGFDDFEYAKQAIKLNIIEYILKPVNVEELTDILKRLKVRMDERIAEKRDVEALRENYKRILPVMKEHFLSDVLHDKIPPEQIAEGFERFELFRDIDAPEWAAVVVHIEIPEIPEIPDIPDNPMIPEMSGKAESQAKLSLHRERELIPLSVKNLMQETLDGRYVFADYVLSDGLCAIFALKNEKELEKLTGVLNQICADCGRILELSVTVGIGEACKTMDKLSESYREAKDALGYRTIMGSGIAIFIKDVERSHKEQLQFTEQDEGELLAAIKFGGRDEIIRVVDRLVNKLEQGRVHTSQYQIYLISITNCLMYLMQKYELDLYQVWGRETDYLEVISHLVTAESMRNFLVNLCTAISENVNLERDNAVRNTIKDAKSYILENYTNPELSVEMVCEYLHLSQAYFSTLFKKETGQSYVNYITELRLNKAVELLNRTDDKTYVIAAKVGYTEPNYFSYVFKKQFGVSPSKYRNEPPTG